MPKIKVVGQTVQAGEVGNSDTHTDGQTDGQTVATNSIISLLRKSFVVNKKIRSLPFDALHSYFHELLAVNVCEI